MDLSKVSNLRDSNQLTRAYFDSILVEARYLDSCVPDLTMSLFGKTFASPIMIAAFSHLSGTHPLGMVEMAKGAKLSGILNWAGMGDEDEFTRIRETGAETIKIVKPYQDREKVFRYLKHAEKEGALAVGMDIDHSFDHRGYNDVCLGMEMKPVTREELASFVKATNLPFVVKGVLSVQDAVKCRDAGVSGILLSHHHGIQPYAIPPLAMLPRIKKAIGNSMEIFVDCSVDTGADAFKCLALGAKAVCVGRAILPSLHDDGAEGVKKYIEHMTDDLRALMARTASRSLLEIPSGVLYDASTLQPLS